jgi:ABC-type Zn2+ transport system substrate-binding protein/surface adhesin
VTYDTNEGTQIQIGDLPDIKKTVIRNNGEEIDEENEEEEEEEEEEKEEEKDDEDDVEEDEEEEYDSEGNVLPRLPVLYDSSEEEDFLDGRRMKTHLRKSMTSTYNVLHVRLSHFIILLSDY